MIDDRRLYQLLGERLRKLREEFDSPDGRMTQAGLASLVGLERTSITNIEKGTQKVSLHALYAICDALHANVADVLPSPSVVVRESALPQKTEVEFGGKTYFAPPKALQRISAILDMDERDEASHH